MDTCTTIVERATLEGNDRKINMKHISSFKKKLWLMQIVRNFYVMVIYAKIGCMQAPSGWASLVTQ